MSYWDSVKGEYINMRAILLLLLAGCVMAKPCATGFEFVGVKYQNSPLGEAILPDADPLIRFDAFDCTTFVETVLANSNVGKLNHIRYRDGKVGFLTRNHFIESDWLQNNADLVENVSADFAPTKIHTVQIDKANWFKVVHGIDAYFDVQIVDIEYIPYEFVSDIRVDEMHVVLFVADNSKKRDKIGTDLAVVHMGLLLPNGVLRHASSVKKMVVDVDFIEYTDGLRQNADNLGVAVVKIK